MFKHILLPTDGSAASLVAVEKGAILAKSLGAAVSLMSAIDRSSSSLRHLGFHDELQKDLLQAADAAAQHWLTQAQAIVATQGLSAQQLTIQGESVHQAILQAAQTSGADLIVMGSHGAGALERLLLGSQTQRVLAHSKVPVLIFR